MLTDLFYALNFSFSIIVSIIGLLCCFTLIILIASHPSSRTVSNLLLVNTCIAVSAGYINTCVVSVYGFYEDWALNQPLCIFRAYSFMVSGIAICYSYFVQAISRLFFVVFFKHKHLLTFQAHWYLITVNWIISFLGPIPPFLVKDGYKFDSNARLCLPSENDLPMTILILIIGFVIPLNLSIVVYYKIWRHTSQSSRRVIPMGLESATSTTPNTPNMRREMKLARNMTILLSLYGFSGIPITVVLFWRMIDPNNPPPEPLYLLASNAISLFVALMTIALFSMNKQLKDIVFTHIRHARRCCRLRVI